MKRMIVAFILPIVADARSRLVLSRRSVVCGLGAIVPALPATATSAAATTEVFTFNERPLGLELVQRDGLVRIERILSDSPALAKGVPPLANIVEVNGVSTADLSVDKVQALIRSAKRPLELRLDTSAFRALPAVEQTEAAATALGMQTERVNINLLTGPQDPMCAYKTREGDTIEVEYSAMLAASGREFDSSAMRSGRPFAFSLGSGGGGTRGFELGAAEMCIGEEREVRVPPLLGYGKRGSKVYGVPPDATLLYRIKLVSINMQTNPGMRRVDVDDEQRFSEDAAGNVLNAAGL